jgi:lipid II:glycine glycyltransferase (peptidoglycan interpeptide bridge formation enzyme)
MQGFTLEPASLDDLLAQDNLLQSAFWADVKRRNGNQALSFTITSNNGPINSALSGRSLDRLSLLVLIRKLPGPGDLCFAYVPHGPDIALANPGRQEFLKWISGELTPHLPSGCVFLRFDLPWEIDDPADRDTSLTPPFRRAAVDVQVPDTVIIDLQDGEDDILSRMKSKTRYNIRLSSRKGVCVRRGDTGDLDLWYEIARETVARDRITLHAKSYFQTLFKEAENQKDTQIALFFAELVPSDQSAGVASEAVAAIIVTIHGRRGIYHFGGSRSEGRNLMPTYALQWEAIKYAKAAGCTAYDLLGIPPTDDPKHPLHGLYRVKTGFGGKVVHRAGCWDFPLKPFVYQAFRSAEVTRNIYFKKVRRKLKGWKITRLH